MCSCMTLLIVSKQVELSDLNNVPSVEAHGGGRVVQVVVVGEVVLGRHGGRVVVGYVDSGGGSGHCGCWWFKW